jgi:hyperosmotically inducible periplasmic protein
MRIRSRVLAMVMTVALSGPAIAAAQSPVVVERANYDVFKDVSSQVNRYVNFTVFDDVSASVVDGVVTLHGRVTMPYKRQDLERRVSRVAGVRAVQNQIEVLPVSIFDDQLRYRIARAIYGNPTFWHYGAMANPPIHIVVERGHVTLSGVVNSNVERALARSLAIGFGSFSVKNELKTDAEMKDLLEKM